VDLKGYRIMTIITFLSRKEKCPCIVLCAIILSSLYVSACFAQEESVSITTYFPTPQAAYSRLRLAPTQCTTDGICNAPGQMCFDSSINQLLICQGTTWGRGSTPWSMIPGTKNIYLAVSGNVGVGTSTPQSKLDVRGKTDVCIQKIYHYTSGSQRCPPGTAIVQPRAQKPFNFSKFSGTTQPYFTYVDSFYCCTTCYQEAPSGFIYSEGYLISQSFSYSSAHVKMDSNNNGFCDEEIVV
jgi:hypothetical protein